MSGSSWDYLYRRFGSKEEYADAATRFREDGFLLIAAELESAVALIATAEKLIQRHSEHCGPLYALEWLDSGDYGEEQYREEVAKHEASLRNSTTTTEEK